MGKLSPMPNQIYVCIYKQMHMVSNKEVYFSHFLKEKLMYGVCDGDI